MSADLEGQKLLITGGPTRAHLDALRYISNHSSGEMGSLLVEEALARGATVHYLRGVGSRSPLSHPRLTVEEVGTVGDLEAAMRRELATRTHAAVIHAMAVLDFAPGEPFPGKTPSEREEWVVSLRPAPKVIRIVKGIDPDVFLVGFKLDPGATEADLLAAGRKLLAGAAADMVVINGMENALRGPYEATVLVGAEPPVRLTGKESVARHVLGVLGERLTPAAASPAPGPETGGTEMVAALSGKNIIVGVSGGIAAYKAAGLVSRLCQAGTAVTVVMTPGATRFVGPATFAALTGRTVYADIFAPGEELRHIQLAAAADAAVVAPATAGLLARVAAGMADDALCLTLLALDRRTPVLLAPAMNSLMWQNPAVRRNVESLRAMGYRFVGPDHGHLAEGSTGYGRMSGEEDIFRALAGVLSRDGGKRGDGAGGI